MVLVTFVNYCERTERANGERGETETAREREREREREDEGRKTFPVMRFACRKLDR